jgi:diguanylate cyclase (GGDEF)-like protein
VPSLLFSDFTIDLPTLAAITVFVSATAGLLMLVSWLQNRSTPALALWGCGYLLGVGGAVLIASHGLGAGAPSSTGANALICLAYASMWGGARSFEGRNIPFAWMGAGAAIWIAACHLPILADDTTARFMLLSAILAAYSLLAAVETRYARDPELISRWPAFALVLIHAGFMLARIPLAPALLAAMSEARPRSPLVLVFAFEALFVFFSVAVLRIAMSKERAELAQRKAALTDSLTGVPNRRAFFDVGGSLLERTFADRRNAALLLFDLDRFKQVNDTAGHQAGDHVLKCFSNLVVATLSHGDLFGRLGGEEFAALLTDTSMAEALKTAERLRRDFEAMSFSGLTTGATVSIGIAMTGETRHTLNALLASADRALYRAKAEGRNRVASAPLIVVDRPTADIPARAPDISTAAALAPLAG